MYLLIIDIQGFLPKIWHVKRSSSWVFILHRRSDIHIVLSGIFCHVRLYKIFPDITLNVVGYVYLLIINIPFSWKCWHVKRVAGYLFRTRRNVLHIIISSITCKARLYKIFPDITLNLVSYLYLLIINIPGFLFSKFWPINREAGYLFCKILNFEKNGTLIIKRSSSLGN